MPPSIAPESPSASGASQPTQHTPVPPAPAHSQHAPIPPAPDGGSSGGWEPAPQQGLEQQIFGYADGGTAPQQYPPAQYSPAQQYTAAQQYPQAQQQHAPAQYPPAQQYAAAQQYPPAQQGYPAAYQPDAAQWSGQDAYGQQAYGPATAQNPAVGRGSKRRLTPGWIAFIVLDVALLAAVIVIAMNLFGSPSPSMGRDDDVAAGGPTTPSPSVSAPAPTVLDEFASPSKNITCQITDQAVTCGIAQLNQAPAPVEDCDGTTGYVVTISAADGEVSLPCVPTSQQPKAAPDDLKQLAYGASATAGAFTCSSADTGMTCRHDPTGRSFTVAKAGIGTS